MTPPSDRKVGRPSVLDEATVAEAVLAVGFEDLTFAAVADQLGAAQATLYRHCPNRDALVRLGLDLALRRMTWPDLNGHWKPLLERWAVGTQTGPGGRLRPGDDGEHGPVRPVGSAAGAGRRGGDGGGRDLCPHPSTVQVPSAAPACRRRRASTPLR